VQALEHAALVQREREVQCGLPAERRKDRLRTLAFEDRLERTRLELLDVRAATRTGELRIRHDRRGIGIDEHDVIALFTEGFRTLCSRIIELARLADDDGARANEQDFLDVRAPGHERCLTGKSGGRVKLSG